MVFERKVTSKGRRYWVLIHPVRKGKRVVQKSRYLGKVLPPRERLERLKKEFLMALSGQRYKYLSAQDVEKIEEKKALHEKSVKKMGVSEKGKDLKEFIIRFTYDSSKLAGVPVTLRQTSMILKEGIIPEDFRNLKNIKALENHEKGFMVLTKYKGKLDLKFIKKLHGILFSGVDDEIAGKTRFELKRDVKLAGTSYVPPKWHELKRELGNFFKWYEAENKRLHALELAALVHLKMISLQLFMDGNSRLSRLLMNWILWKKSYPLVDIPIEDLENYYGVLDNYQIEKREKPFVDYIKQKYMEGY